MKLSYNLHSLQKRILAFVVLISFIFCVLIIRLSVIQLINGKWLQEKATSQWTRDLPLTAERGKIYDSTGSALAVSYTSYDIYTRGREIQNAEDVARFLSEILDLDYENTLKKVSDKSVSEVLIKLQVEEEIGQQIINKGYKGVLLSESVKRYYPYGDLLTQVLGFTSIDNVGQAGLEAYYDTLLKGVKGYSMVQSDLQGKELENSLRTYVPAIPGMNINLTIDSKIQLIVERELGKCILEQEAKSGTAIVMNPKTGEILALSSKPSFDLNNIPRDNVSALMQMVKNQAIVDVYEPGSTFKIITMASSVDSGVAHLSDTFYDPGYRIVDGQKIKCWKLIGHGHQDLTDGLCNSCNAVFVDLALRLGLNRFYEYLSNFGFGTRTGIEFDGESVGIMMDSGSVKNVDLARIGFGQTVAVTPLQLISAISACVNGGILYEPYMVKEIYSNEGYILQKNEPKQVRRVISEETSSIMRTMIEEVVSKTGKYTFVEGYEVGGKTGTTQKYEDGKISGKYISSFVGIYPASNPDYVVLFIVDEPGTGQYYGSVVASPYAKEIFKGIFEYKDIQPNGTPERVKNVEMPNVEGMPLADAVVILKGLGLNVEIQGEGGFVESQLPPEKTKLYEGSEVVLVTS